MPKFQSLEPAIDPNNRITFLLDWELTMKCNLDCSYCRTDLYGGHNNDTEHPPLKDCLETLDFLYRYADLYMEHKPKGLRYVILNVYGGEALHHPEITEILSQARKLYEPYRDRWNLTITTTTNAIVSSKKMSNIIPLIDEFTVSYHAENTQKQLDLFKSNLLAIKGAGVRQKCVVLMHDRPDLFEDAKNMIGWLESNDIKYLPRHLDNIVNNPQINPRKSVENPSGTYNQQQIKWFNGLYQKKSHGPIEPIEIDADKKLLSAVGRACCGGRQTCQDQDYSNRKFYVMDNRFPDWYCSVNWFFVFVKQLTKEVFVNKDCKMNFNGEIGPIGTLDAAKEILEDLKVRLATGTLNIIQCKKDACVCGLCAPKAATKEIYQSIIKKYQI